MFVLTAWAAESAAEQASGIAALGFDVPGLIFQVINFIVLLWLLKRFAYKPILKILSDRQRAIAEGLKSAASASAEREKMLKEKQRLLSDARGQAQTIVAEGKRQAQEIVQLAEEKAEAQAQNIVEQAEARITQSENEVRAALRKETLDLVMRSTEKVIDQKLDTEADQALVASAIKEAQS